MKKLITSITLAALLGIAAPSFAQDAGARPHNNMTAEQRAAVKAKMKEKWQNATPEEKEAMKKRFKEHRAKREAQGGVHGRRPGTVENSGGGIIPSVPTK